MREIKFRAWDKIAKRWRYVSGLSWYKPITSLKGRSGVIVEMDDGCDQFIPIEDVELVQFTGLHDKNGKPIYEGDLLSFNGQKPSGAVFFKEGSYWTSESVLGRAASMAEVIGNVYENSDLV